MRDDAWRVAPYPVSMDFLTFEGANAIEANLRYIFSQFSLFEGQVLTEVLGTFGYLELSEKGSAGAVFVVSEAIRINRLTVRITGDNLAPLSWSGNGWTEAARSATQLEVFFDSDGNMSGEELQNALNGLLFSSTVDLDVVMYFTAANVPEVSFDTLGPVTMIFRGGAVWALIEGLGLTWSAIEAADMTWRDLEGLRKPED